MAAREACVEHVIRRPSAEPRGLRDWPRSVVALALRRRRRGPRAGRARPARSPGSATSASAARPARAAATIARMVGPAARLEGLRPRAARGHRPPHGAPDRRGPGLRRARPERRPGLAPAAPRGALRPAGSLPRPPRQARSRRSAGPASRSSSAGARASCCRARTTLSVRIIAPLKCPGRAPGRADGRLGPDRPPGRRATSTAAGPSSTAPCTGSTRPTRTTTTSCSTRTAWAWTIAAEVIVRAVEAGRPARSWTSPGP